MQSDLDATDVAAYLRFVGLPETGWTPTLSALRELVRAHVDTITFATVSHYLGRPPPLDLPTVHRRLVVERRGGTCLEQVPLFGAVLAALGFRSDVRMSIEDIGGHAQQHLTVLVQPVDDDRRWLADIGLGVSVLGPVPLPHGVGLGEIVRHERWEQRVEVTDDGRMILLERGPPPSYHQWRPLHVTTDVDVSHAAIEDANHRLMFPPSPLAGRLIALRVGDGTRERFNGRQLEVYTGAGAPDVHDLTPAAALEMLERRFNVVVDADERVALLAKLEPSSSSPHSAHA